MLRRLTAAWLPPSYVWVPRLLSRAGTALALALVLLVVVSPWLVPADGSPRGWGRLLTLFARDAALRRTALACAVGLAVTARIFFRPPDHRLPPPRRRLRPPPPSGVAGA